jgi:putative ABC transport system ATP-binding protein
MTSITTPSAEPPAAATLDAVKVYGEGDGAVRALDGVTVEFEQGRFTAIMGPSGSGKSTLMHVVAGLDLLTSGQAWVGGRDLAELSDRELTRLRRDEIGFVFQAFNLLPTLSARENIALPRSLAGERPDPAWMDEVVATLGLGDRLSHRPSELSGGQQQRVAIARALVAGPRLTFADEPTGNLDSRSTGEILDFLGRAVHELGQTVVMVTHDPVAASCADRVLFLADGRLVDEMSEPEPERVLDRLKQVGERVAA